MCFSRFTTLGLDALLFFFLWHLQWSNVLEHARRKKRSIDYRYAEPMDERQIAIRFDKSRPVAHRSPAPETKLGSNRDVTTLWSTTVPFVSVVFCFSACSQHVLLLQTCYKRHLGICMTSICLQVGNSIRYFEGIGWLGPTLVDDMLCRFKSIWMVKTCINPLNCFVCM